MGAVGLLAAAWLIHRLLRHTARTTPLSAGSAAGTVLPRGQAPAAVQHRSPFVPLTAAGRLLLPVFFVVSGSAVDLRTLTGEGLWFLAAVLPLAVAGKVLGGYLGARAGRLPPDGSLTVGILLNTRGLTELIVLSLGLAAGLLDRAMYTGFVMMALVTTAMTGPLPAGRGMARGAVTRGRAPLPPDQDRA
ncbi:cation:proton antiporter domain-containing protein [Streptomyces lydicus]|uniref:cation:proton antiporter domain-containing protein n=1 Tax=Streptomyces lydicus TaxID=47763 RepID=UPI00379AC4B7